MLKPGGRLSMFEPINRFASDAARGTFYGFDTTPVAELMKKIRGAYEAHDPAKDGECNHRNLRQPNARLNRAADGIDSPRS